MAPPRPAGRAGDPDRLEARERLKAAAHEVLALLARLDIQRPLRVRCRNALHEVEVRLGPAGSSAPAGSGELPPMFLSPLGAAIVNAIGPGGTLIGKQIASACSQPFSATFRLHLQELLQRGVLAKGAGGQGYRWSDAFRALRGV